MIYITGDVHGDVIRRFNPAAMPGEDAWTAEDKIIVLGDFGLIFYPRIELFTQETEQEKRKLAYLENKPYEILFIDGNHEDFDRLTTEFPEEERYGGPVRRIGRNVFWLRRGGIYTIEGKTFFCMGGAYSIDKPIRLNQDRIIRDYYGGADDAHFSWWPQELPSNEEYDLAVKNLIAHDRRVDYVISHTAPRSLIYLMGHNADPHDFELTGFLDWIWYEIGFRHWYFGHWHVDESIHQKATAVYYDVIGLPGGRGDKNKSENNG